ncbi:aldo/keto reductase [Azotobacter chroococcum]|uniref:Aldo/keto reductase n=1 Tax=Azotobacter chroococcum TaxID=353 RepID=A0AA43Z7G8_9GAMM|nr:aldo/keto reductase [Azotobacter chroococcum]NHN77483.1 aldo/keto reductase [Azotobacter chroococcum]
MSTRRQLLSAVATGTAVLAAAPLFAQAQGPGSLLPTPGTPGSGPVPTNAPIAGGKFRPFSRIGLGGVAIGNGFAPASGEQSQATLQAAFAAGVRYFDTSPWYGLGLGERRFGHFLHGLQREEYVLSSKVGRLLTATDSPPKTMWQEPSPFAYRYDYSAEGVRRSIEDSLQRLGVSYLDIVFIHDLSPDNRDMGERWSEYFAQAARGAIPELSRMRREGLIKAWGFGVNHPAPALRALEAGDPDIFLLACQYSLLDHREALDNTFPQLARRGVSVVVGAPLLAGYLAGRDRYLYAGSVPAWAPEKRARIMAVAERHGIDLRTAALQFAAAHPLVSAVIPGARTPEQVQANVQSMQVAIPGEFWEALKREQLIAPNAPVPAQA